jgi:adenylate kinase family enzyme
VGDLLREEAKRPSSVYADFINKSIRESVIIPAQLTCDLVKLKMNGAREGGIHQFLVDGFPRSLEQAVKFEEKVPFSFPSGTSVDANVTNVPDSRGELHHTLGLPRGRDGRSTLRAREGIWENR